MLAFFSPPVILTVRLLLIQPDAKRPAWLDFFHQKMRRTRRTPHYYIHAFFRCQGEKLKFFLKIQGFFTMTRPSQLSRFCFCENHQIFAFFRCCFCLKLNLTVHLTIQHIHDQEIHVREDRNNCQHPDNLQHDQVRAVHSNIC